MAEGFKSENIARSNSETGDIDSAATRESLGVAAGNEYTNSLEGIRDGIENNEGTTLGKMVGAQLNMTEAETKYQVKSSIPKKASKSVKAASDEIKQAQ